MLVHQTPLSGVRDGGVFWGLVAMLGWLPIPLGSNRTFAIAILVGGVVVLALMAMWSWRHQAQSCMVRLASFKWPVGVLFLLVCYVWLQGAPLPRGVVEFISPESAAVQSHVGSQFLSLDVFQARLYAALSTAYLLVFVLVLLSVRTPQRLKQLAYSLVCMGVFQAVLAVFLYSSEARYTVFFFDVEHDRAKGTFSYHNYLAAYLVMCLSVGIGLMLGQLGGLPSTHRRGWRQRLHRALEFMLSPTMRLRLMLVVMVIALVLTRSRMGNTAFFVSLLVVGLLALALTRRQAPALVALVISLLVVDVVVIGSWVGLQKVVDRVQNTSLTRDGGGADESVQARQEAAQYAMALVADFPATGTGAGSFYGTYPRYRSVNRHLFDHAHNDYVELAADLGLVGLALLGLLVLSTSVVAVKTLARRSENMLRGTAFGVLMVVIALGLHSTVDFNLQLPANATTAIVVLAMAWVAWAMPAVVESA